MHTKNVDVKSKGDVVANIDVAQFDTLDEARQADGDEAILKAYNKALEAKAANEARTDATREVNPITKLNRLAKKDPAVAARIAELLAEVEEDEEEIEEEAAEG